MASLRFDSIHLVVFVCGRGIIEYLYVGSVCVRCVPCLLLFQFHHPCIVCSESKASVQSSQPQPSTNIQWHSSPTFSNSGTQVCTSCFCILYFSTSSPSHVCMPLAWYSPYRVADWRCILSLSSKSSPSFFCMPLA